MAEEFRASRYRTYWHHDKRKSAILPGGAFSETESEGEGSGGIRGNGKGKHSTV
ncbi:hypothetical protein BT69DRAFT_1278963 [Atractiella rhizophila]|nr:hypothetical protein BT69DRAFT_1278963 [Atractiella rhizophila]